MNGWTRRRAEALLKLNRLLSFQFEWNKVHLIYYTKSRVRSRDPSRIQDHAGKARYPCVLSIVNTTVIPRTKLNNLLIPV